jgi:hypothetical protein
MINPVINPMVRDNRNPKNNLHNVIAVPLIKVKSNNNSIIVWPTASGEGRDNFGNISDK